MATASSRAVDEALFALVVKRVGDIDIFVDDGLDRHVVARAQLIGRGAQDRPHRLVEPVERPAGREARGDQRVELVDPRRGTLNDIVEERDLGIGVFDVLDRRAQPVLVEFVQQNGDRRRFHLALIQCLDGGKSGGGAWRGGWVS